LIDNQSFKNITFKENSKKMFILSMLTFCLIFGLLTWWSDKLPQKLKNKNLGLICYFCTKIETVTDIQGDIDQSHDILEGKTSELQLNMIFAMLSYDQDFWLSHFEKIIFRWDEAMIAYYNLTRLETPAKYCLSLDVHSVGKVLMIQNFCVCLLISGIAAGLVYAII
jgi:hypothetical protein